MHDFNLRKIREETKNVINLADKFVTPTKNVVTISKMICYHIS